MAGWFFIRIHSPPGPLNWPWNGTESSRSEDSLRPSSACSGVLNKNLAKEMIISGIFAACFFGSIFTFFKFFTLRDCFEGIRDCIKKKDGGYKGGFSKSDQSGDGIDWIGQIVNPWKSNDQERKKELMMDLWQQFEFEVWWWRHRISKSPSARLESLLEKTSSKIFENRGPPKSDLIWSQFRWIKLIKSSISTTSCLLISSSKQFVFWKILFSILKWFSKL